jgi:hypothetical protein
MYLLFSSIHSCVEFKNQSAFSLVVFPPKLCAIESFYKLKKINLKKFKKDL